LRLKILKKLRTASLNSEFTGSYKKSVLLNTFCRRYLFNTSRRKFISSWNQS